MRRVAPARTLVVLFATLVGLACADPATAPESAASFAKGSGGAGVTVQSTMPSRTEPGTTLDVRVLGSGFDAGTRVSFALGGVATSKIVTNGTTFVAPNELVANITVAGDAQLASYDVVATTTGGKKGIGTEMFLVSYTMTDLGGHPTLIHTTAVDVTASGLIVGNAGRGVQSDSSHVMRWQVTGIGTATATDLHPLFQPALRSVAYAINEAGDIVGFVQPTTDPSGSRPFLLTGAGTVVRLHTRCGPDETSRQGHVYDISETGAMIGTEINQGIVGLYWAPGALCAEALPTLGFNAEPIAINAAGDVIVGISQDAARNQFPVRWNRTADGTAWELTKLAAPYPYAQPSAIGPDGTIVGWDQPSTLVRKRGTSYYDFSANAYRWSSAAVVERLPTLGGDQAYAWDTDGSRVVGYGNDRIDYPSRALLWDADGSLKDLGVFVMGGNSSALGIRGNFIVGRSDVDTPGRGIVGHAVVWTIP